MLSTRNLSPLPEPATLRRLMRSLAMLEAPTWPRSATPNRAEAMISRLLSGAVMARVRRRMLSLGRRNSRFRAAVVRCWACSQELPQARSAYWSRCR